MHEKTKCKRIFLDGGKCNRHAELNGFCYFHGTGYPSDKEGISRFWWRLKRLFLKGDVDWRGFRFPYVEFSNMDVGRSVNLSHSEIPNINISLVRFLGTVNADNCQFTGNCTITSCSFEHLLSFKESSFNHDFKMTNTCVEKGLIAVNSNFKGDFFLSGSFKVLANLNQSKFYSKAEFLQRNHIVVKVNSIDSTATFGSPLILTVSKNNQSSIGVIVDLIRVHYYKFKRYILDKLKLVYLHLKKVIVSAKEKAEHKLNYYRQKLPHKREGVVRHTLFDGIAHLEEVVFLEPKKVIFKGVNLKNATFRGTDLRNVTFIGNDWYQPELGRNGLKDELRSLGLNNYYDKKESFPDVENIYRNIRYSFEENKDFVLANDFFIGEMDAKRRSLPWYKRYFFSIPAIYKLISNYGTSPMLCGFWFIILIFSHMLIISSIANTELFNNIKTLINNLYLIDHSIVDFSSWKAMIISNIDKVFLKSDFLKSLTYSIQTLTLQRDKVELITPAENSSYIVFFNSIYTLLGPIMMALFAMSVRTRIKRN